VSARFVSFDDVRARLRGKTIAVVGSAPSCTENAPGFVDSHDLVLRVNNYKTGTGQGRRTDIHYSFYGSSIRKTKDELRADGVTLCMCKCPNSSPIESEWHVRMGKPHGIAYQYIYRIRKDFWFCDTFIPTDEHFLETFNCLQRHQPTSGFAAIYDVVKCEPARVFVTGFDFFSSGLHNVTDKWRPGNPDDPIGHRPDFEAMWLFEAANRFPLQLDAKLVALREAVCA
jgi:hypothetical protein